MKKSLVILFLTLAALWAGFSLDWGRGAGGTCLFCDPSILSAQVVYQGKMGRILLNHKPAVPGHLLVIPSRHVERFEDLTGEEAAEMRDLIARVDKAEKRLFGATGYLLLQKNGKEAGQSVPHVHFHYFPRKAGDSKVFLIVRMLTAPWMKPVAAKDLEKLQLEFKRDGFAD